MYRTKPLIRPRPAFWVALLFAVAAITLAAFSGSWLGYRLGYALMLALAASYLLARLSLRGLEVEIDRHTDRVQEGDSIAGELRIRNASAWPKVWLQVDDPADLPGHSSSFVVSLGARRHRTRRLATVCERRGVYSMGPARVRAGDPFGFFEATRYFGEAERVLVYPRPLELSNFQVPAANLPGDGRFRRRTHYVTPNAGGVRHYETGDSFNRIHWPSSARLGELMVKLFELDPASDVWIALDLDEGVQAGSGVAGTEEVGVKIAASIARAFLLAQRAAGFLAFGQRLDVVDADRGQQQLTRILETLAVARATGDVPLAGLLYEEGRRFGRHTTLVAITSSVDESWVAAMQSLAQRGVKVAAVYLEPETFGSDESSLLVFGALTASGLPAYFIRRGDDLIVALSPTGQEANLDRHETIFGPRGERR